MGWFGKLVDVDKIIVSVEDIFCLFQLPHVGGGEPYALKNCQNYGISLKILYIDMPRDGKPQTSLFLQNIESNIK